jgi:Ser/Thr protein kinase RdoA (MazF antagonist)
MSLAEPPGIEQFRARRRATFYPKTDLPFSRTEVQEILERKKIRTLELRPTISTAAELFFGQKNLIVEALPLLGTFHSLYRVAVGNERWIFKVNALDLFGPACELLVDEQVCRVLQGRDFPVPAVLKTEVSRLGIDFDFEILQEAPGVLLKQIEDPETQAIPESILVDLGRRLAEVHQVHARGFGLLDAYPPFVGVQTSWREYIWLNLSDHVARCFVLNTLSGLDVETIEDFFVRAESILKTAPCRLLHGDPGHHNIFVHDEKVSCVIDWEDALAGDPVFDLAYWGTFCRDEMREPLLNGYRQVVALEDEFEIRYWLYYLRIALSKTVHRSLFSYKDRPGRPPASRRIQKALQNLQKLGL